jgi:hypothetical protein
MPNPALDFSAMAGDLGLSDDPSLSVLIDVLSGTGKIDTLSLLRSQLDAQTRDNPKVALLLRLLERRQQQASEPQAEAVPDSEEEALSEHEEAAEETRRQRAHDIKKLEETVNKVYAELEALRARNDSVAAALGACHMCFGEDPLCEECDGLGLPGSLTPEPAAFRKYVLPAFCRAKAVETQRGGSAPKREHASERRANRANSSTEAEAL